MTKETCTAIEDDHVCALLASHISEQQPAPIHESAEGVQWSGAFD